MKLRLSSLLCAALACASLCSAAEDEVVVLLGSEHALLPTYLSPIAAASTDLSQEYLGKLQNVLTFDLDHNGMTRVVAGKEKESAATAAHSGPDGSVDLPALRNLGLSYLINWKAQGRDIEASVVQATSGTTRSISPVTCSGDLSKDRGRIHQLADCIFQALFGKPGVASTKILYTLKKRIGSGTASPNTVSEIFESDYDGQNARQLTHIGSMCTSSVWVPPRTPGVADQSGTQKSQTFLYVSYELGQPKIYAASLRDNRVYRVTTMRGNQLTPAISRDGAVVAFCSDVTGTADLYIVPFESGVGSVGKPRQIFHAKGTATGCPSFSPDGSKVAFVSNKDGAAKIYVMNIPPLGAKSADLNPALVSKRCRESTTPAWSPDGKKIAYSAKNSGERQIWIYDVENRTEQQLTDGRGGKESPSWAPDSIHLVFHAFTKEGCDLYMVNTNQPTPVKITSGAGEKLFPSWEPRPQ